LLSSFVVSAKVLLFMFCNLGKPILLAVFRFEIGQEIATSRQNNELVRASIIVDF